MENQQRILKLAQEISGFVEDGGDIRNLFHKAGLCLGEIIHLGLFHGDAFFRLKEFAKHDRYHNSHHPYVRASIEVINWIRDNPACFSFDLPEFYMDSCYAHQMNCFMRAYWQINIPALAKVIELQCEVESAETHDQEDLPILSENAAIAYEILLEQPPHKGIIGPELLKIIDSRGHGIENSVLTGRIIPELKPYGIENAPKKGYRIPQSKRPKNS